VTSFNVTNNGIFVGERSLYSNYLVQSSFLFGVVTALPHLFFQHYTPEPLQILNRKRKMGGTWHIIWELEFSMQKIQAWTTLIVQVVYFTVQLCIQA